MVVFYVQNVFTLLWELILYLTQNKTYCAICSGFSVLYKGMDACMQPVIRYFCKHSENMNKLCNNVILKEMWQYQKSVVAFKLPASWSS
jgi:hypothetical protein